ncbi:MAG: Gfo/Idh/MocA family oxidoreductase [Synergistaceae bacterium]|nr:Gfo/Idh/MocA family oxidoreductase [Synergistaceae bacterium]
MSEAFRTGVVGCGNVGHFHAKIYAELPESKFVGVCSSSLDKARAFAEVYGVPAFPDVETMKRETDVQVVSICTPHPAHAQNAVEAAGLGIHLLIEKPLADSLGGCDAILRAAEKNGVKVGTISQRRFYPSSMRVRQALDDGKIGKPILGMVAMLGWRDKDYYDSGAWRGSWKGEGGGVLVNQAPHQMDLLLWYMGEVDELYGVWDNLSHPYIEVEDTAAAVVRFKSGALGNIVVTNSVNPALYGKVHVFGDNGAGVGVQTDGGAMFIAGRSSVTDPPVNDLWTVPGEEEMLPQWKREDEELFTRTDPTRHFHKTQIEDFLNALRDGRPPLVDGYAGRRTVELFTAIYRSRKGGVVKFPLVPEDDGTYDGRLTAAP